MSNSIEYILSNLLKEDLINYIDTNPGWIGELIHLAKSNKPPHSSRAAWLLSKIIIKKGVNIKGHITQFLDILPLVEDSQKRDLINVLYESSMNEKEEGILYDICVSIWCSVNKIVSVRFSAFRFILKTCEKYSDLSSELILLTEDHYLEPLSKGMKSTIIKKANSFKKKSSLES